MLDIRSDPFKGPRCSPQRATTGQTGEPAEAALSKRPNGWVSDAGWASDVKTSLSRFDVSTSARLLRHGYALAAMNIHVFLDGPLVDIPPLEEFEALCHDED